MSNPFNLPAIPAALQHIIDTDRERFAGWKMQADPADDGAAGGANDKTDPDPTKDTGKDEPLGEAGKKTLDKERAQRKELEKQVAGLKAFQEGLAKLVSPEGDEQVKPEDALAKLAEKVEKLTHSNLVKDIARETGISAKADLDLLSEMKSEDQIRALAERLKPADDGKDKDKNTRQQYRPDPSAGKGGGEGKSGSVAEVMAARRAAREAKSKT